VRVSLLFAWYDLWVGFFWDRTKRRLYILPFPCCGIVIDFRAISTGEG
jgi:hypothetical protein